VPGWVSTLIQPRMWWKGYNSFELFVNAPFSALVALTTPRKEPVIRQSDALGTDRAHAEAFVYVWHLYVGLSRSLS
jgi:hypothetical protein